MRVFIAIVMMLCLTAAKAQSVISNSWMPGMYGAPFTRTIPLHDSSSKWSFSKYASLSMGYSFYKGGSASFISAPVGIQLNRKLNNNLYAFTGVSVAPTYINFNSTFIPNNSNKLQNSFFTKGNQLAMYGRAELGLMYVNDARTFSISGSIGVERSSAPVYYSAPASRQNPAFIPAH